jgi:hypothetical protein
MNKKKCINLLNEVLEIIPETDCFEFLCEQLDLDEDELDFLLQSKITNIENDDILE